MVFSVLKPVLLKSLVMRHCFKNHRQQSVIFQTWLNLPALPLFFFPLTEKKKQNKTTELSFSAALHQHGSSLGPTLLCGPGPNKNLKQKTPTTWCICEQKWKQWLTRLPTQCFALPFCRITDSAKSKWPLLTWVEHQIVAFSSFMLPFIKGGNRGQTLKSLKKIYQLLVWQKIIRKCCCFPNFNKSP